MNRTRQYARPGARSFRNSPRFSRIAVAARGQQDKSQSTPQRGTKSAVSQKAPSATATSETEEFSKRSMTLAMTAPRLSATSKTFLQKYPESQQRPQIYRALVEASLQLQDSARATEYAERIVALAPEDISMTVLAIQLLESNGDEAALRRAVSYSTRVLEYVQRNTSEEKSPKISKEEWEAEQKRDETNILSLRGRLAFKLHDYTAAEKDFRASMALSPSASAGEKLGEIAELNKDLPGAIREYARAFALADALGYGSQSPRDPPKAWQCLAARARLRSRPRRLSPARLRRARCVFGHAQTGKKRRRQRALRFQAADRLRTARPIHSPTKREKSSS